MTDYRIARENMIESQVRPNGITDHRIIDAMAGLAREDFVPAQRKSIAYVDEDIELVPGRYLIEAMAFAKLVQLAEIKPGDSVLHVGAASGYGTAVLAKLANRVVALESDAGLCGLLRHRVADLGNVKVVEGPLDAGAASDGPFDVIVVEGRAGEIPQKLLGQLANDGRLVAVTGEQDVGKAQVWTSHGGSVAVRAAFDASVAALPGLAKKRPAFVF